MGVAVGEALVAASELAVERKAPLIAITASGGARMQEGALSLMQMPRTVIAVQIVKEAGLPYIVLLTDPTTGGVSASFASRVTSISGTGGDDRFRRCPRHRADRETHLRISDRRVSERHGRYCRQATEATRYASARRPTIASSAPGSEQDGGTVSAPAPVGSSLWRRATLFWSAAAPSSEKMIFTRPCCISWTGLDGRRLPPVVRSGDNGKGSSIMRAMLEAAGYRAHVATCTPRRIWFGWRADLGSRFIGVLEDCETANRATPCYWIDGSGFQSVCRDAGGHRIARMRARRPLRRDLRRFPSGIDRNNPGLDGPYAILGRHIGGDCWGKGRHTETRRRLRNRHPNGYSPACDRRRGFGPGGVAPSHGRRMDRKPRGGTSRF